MKNYYNVTVNLSEILESFSFTLSTNGVCGVRLVKAALMNEWHPFAYNLDAIRSVVYYHLADHLIQKHLEQSTLDSAAPTVMNRIRDAIEDKGGTVFDNDDDNAVYWIDQGMETGDLTLIRKGLFRAFVFELNDGLKMDVVQVGEEERIQHEVLEFDFDDYAEQLQAYGQKEEYSVQMDIYGCYGATIEEFYECTISIHPYLGEMLLNYSYYDLEEYDNRFFGGLFDAMKYKAAEKLHRLHKSLKDDPYFLQHKTSLEQFWEMALEEGDIDDEEYKEIMADIENDAYIDRICEIIDNNNLLAIQDLNRNFSYKKSDPNALSYED